jgi:hypothetical protein
MARLDLTPRERRCSLAVVDGVMLPFSAELADVARLRDANLHQRVQPIQLTFVACR